MEKSARQSVFEGLELLPEPLAAFVESRLEAKVTGHWQVQVAQRLNLRPNRRGAIAWDQAALLRVMNVYWRDAFAPVLGRTERAIVNELADVRNRLSHNEPFTADDAERALDSMRRLMAAIGATDEERTLASMREAIIGRRFERPPSQPGGGAPGAETSLPDSGNRRRFGQAAFDAELRRMLAEARAAGQDRRRVISRDLHRRVVGGSQPNHMPSACSAMWKLWREQGGDERNVVHTTPSGRSSTIEIDFSV